MENRIVETHLIKDLLTSTSALYSQQSLLIVLYFQFDLSDSDVFQYLLFLSSLVLLFTPFFLFGFYYNFIFSIQVWLSVLLGFNCIFVTFTLALFYFSYVIIVETLNQIEYFTAIFQVTTLCGIIQLDPRLLLSFVPK